MHGRNFGGRIALRVGNGGGDTMTVRHETTGAARRVLAVGAAFLLSSCAQEGVLDPHGPVAAAERLILVNATAIMLVVVVPVIVLTFAFAWWYRSGNGRAAYRPDFQYSGAVELVVWSIPAMIILLLAGVTWISSHQLDPYRKLARQGVKPLAVQVVALNWKWLFIYPDQKVASVNALVIPVGTPIDFAITSDAVMNAFFIPQLGSQVYAMPTMAMRLSLLADHPGTYAGFSSHYSGEGFPGMRFAVRAVSPAEFQAWVDRTRGAGAGLDEKTFAALARPSRNVAPATYCDVEPKLFDWIMNRRANAAPDAPGPGANPPGAARLAPAGSFSVAARSSRAGAFPIAARSSRAGTVPIAARSSRAASPDDPGGRICRPREQAALER